MSYCKYHPLLAAPFICPLCETSVCVNCVDEGERGDRLDCILCHKKLEQQTVTSESVLPFWRRLQESFRYPLDQNSLFLILGFALASTLLNTIPLLSLALIVIKIAMLGGMMKYCFSCLEHTALGDMKAPDITEAYGEGLTTFGHLIVMLFFIGSCVYGTENLLGPTFAGLVAIVLIIGFPAMLINYAVTGSLAGALNLAGVFQLILTIGLPYGLLICFIMIMTSSVAVIHELVGGRIPFISTFFQYVVTWFYMVVTFHIMGYMIFQYQDKLGFSALASDELENFRSPEEAWLARINVYIKEGQIENVVSTFDEAIKKFPNNGDLFKKYFDFLIKTKNQKQLAVFADKYLAFQCKHMRFDKLGVLFKQILQISPQYNPRDPDLRYYIARACQQGGDPKWAVKLLSGLHKSHPQYKQLVSAYETLLEALQDIPAMAPQVPKCLALLEKLRKSQAKEEKANPFNSETALSTHESNSENQALNFESPENPAQEEVDPEAPEEPKDLPPIEFKP